MQTEVKRFWAQTFLRCYDCVCAIATLTLLLTFFQILNPHKYHIYDPKEIVKFNPPNMAGRFEGSFSGGINLTTPPRSLHISRLLNNLFKLG